jgi:hypothetical protein
MAIYTWLCKECGQIEDTVQSISEYSDEKTKRVPRHCSNAMERMLTVNGSNSAIAHALAGDRHYDGMRAPDGSMIDTRSKHRAYMKRNNLTIAEDYKGEWATAEKQREARLTAQGGNDRSRRAMIEKAFTQGEQK